MKTRKNVDENSEKLKNQSEKGFGEVDVAEKTAEATVSETEVQKLSPEETEKLREKIEKTDLSDMLKIQARGQADDIKSLDDKKKVEKLFQIAKKKGVIYAIHIAKKMNNPYVLDTLHDILAKEGHYKEFIR